ncbi:hypothetical protein K439DRAFT_1021286 [Ramaria rubella]|nr:hypothetical protein K439DRAFT_1021286 [Ramaria rubella]
MKFITPFVAPLIVALSALAAEIEPVTFDNTFDNPAGSLDSVACSTGTNGLITKGFETFGQLPTFPNIGGGQAVAGFNSVNCGSCWLLQFDNNTIFVTLVDTAAEGFNIAEEAMNTLTNGQAAALGKVNVTTLQVAVANCGISDRGPGVEPGLPAPSST